jgi:simple sugar transport system ATP-binding protein
VSLTVEEGEIHALLGENGAGKTTLMNIVYGLLIPDEGTLRLAGRPYRPASPRDAVARGVGMVHQHFMLVPSLSVAENIVLGENPFGVLDRRRLYRSLSERMREFGFRFPLEARAEELSVGELQRVEIFKALWKGARFLILDEPTAVLSPSEIADLFKLLDQLRAKGRSVLFISHKLEEIGRLCDRVTLLRKGKTIATLPAAETDPGQLSRLMVGRELRRPVRSDKKVRPEGPGFAVHCRPPGLGKLRGEWSLEIAPGRITAVAGIEGNGQRDLAEAILGLKSGPGLRVEAEGLPLPEGVRERIEAGLGLISEDRQETGLVLDFTLAENLMLKDVGSREWSRAGFLRASAMQQRARELVEAFDIQPPQPQIRVAHLSGGNQQKVVVAREISRGPELLVAVNPTRGLDVGAREAVHRALLDQVEKGLAVLLISTELEEILDLADRLYVLASGELAEIPEDRWTKETIGLAMLGQEVAGTG